MSGDLDDEEPRRDLQLEAAAHVRMQATLDKLAINDGLPEPASMAFISQLPRPLSRTITTNFATPRQTMASYTRSSQAGDIPSKRTDRASRIIRFYAS